MVAHFRMIAKRIHSHFIPSICYSDMKRKPHATKIESNSQTISKDTQIVSPHSVIIFYVNLLGEKGYDEYTPAHTNRNLFILAEI